MLLCRPILRLHVPNSSPVLPILQSHSHHGRLAPVKFSPYNARHVPCNRSNNYTIPTISRPDLGMAQAIIPLPTKPPHPEPDPDLLATVLLVSRYSGPKKGINEFKIISDKTVVEESKHNPFEAYMLLRAQIPRLAVSLPIHVLCCIAQGAVRHGYQDLVDSIAADVLGEDGGVASPSNAAIDPTSIDADYFIASTDANPTNSQKTDAHQDINYPTDNGRYSTSPFTLQDRARVAAALLCVPPCHSHLLAKHRVHALLTLINSAGEIDSLPVVAACHAMKAVFDDPHSDPYDRHVINLALPRFLGWLGSWHAPTDARAATYKPSKIILAAYGIVNRLLVLREKQNALALFRVLTENRHIPAEAFQGENQARSTTQHDFGTIIRRVLVRACLHWRWHDLAMKLMTAMTETWNAETQPEQSLNDRERFISSMLDLLHPIVKSCTASHVQSCAVLMCLLARSTGVVIPESTISQFYYRARLFRDGASAEMFYACTQSSKAMRMAYPPPSGITFVWLMNHLIEKKHNVHLGRLLAKQLVKHPVPIPSNERSKLVAMVAKCGFAEYARALWERYAVGDCSEAVVGDAATMVRMVSLFASLISRTRSKLEELERGADADREQTIQEVEARLTDLSQFSEGVVLAFHKLKHPLDKATHYDLNALARAYFLLGMTSQGLLPYRALLRRKEIPDLYDINVALSAVSRYSPRMAAEVVGRMIGTGLHPDAVTFGTVMHQALVHGDLELTSTLVKQAEGCGLKELSEKTMVALIRASVGDNVVTTETLESNLRHVWKIVQATPRTSVVRTPDMGKCCVRACVQVGDADMAFGFWDKLVRWKVEWWDCEQVQLRHAIGQLVRRRIRDGTLGAERGEEMLHALGLG